MRVTQIHIITLMQNSRLEGGWMDILFFSSFNTVHLGAGLSFTPLHPVFVPGLETRADYACQNKPLDVFLALSMDTFGVIIRLT